LNVGAVGSCEYMAKRDKCIAANENGTANGIEDYICLQTTSTEEILYQIILDEKFKEYDTDAKKYISWLETNKDYYFGENRVEYFFSWINELNRKFWPYWEFTRKYTNLCGTDSWSVIWEFVNCIGPTSLNKSKEFFKETTCNSIAHTKIDIYWAVAYNVFKLNKMQIRKDNKKEFFQVRRSAYDNLLNIIMINMGYLERMWHKWPSKTKDNIYGG
jgi:hypothetical protein